MIHKANETCILKVQPPDVVILQHIRKNNIRIASIVSYTASDDRVAV